MYTHLKYPSQYFWRQMLNESTVREYLTSAHAQLGKLRFERRDLRVYVHDFSRERARVAVIIFYNQRSYFYSRRTLAHVAFGSNSLLSSSFTRGRTTTGCVAAGSNRVSSHVASSSKDEVRLSIFMLGLVVLWLLRPYSSYLGQYESLEL